MKSKKIQKIYLSLILLLSLFVEAPNTVDYGINGLEFNIGSMVDFESIRANGTDVAHRFMDQQWGNYFEMLNGLVYYDIVRNFWVKAYVFDEDDAKSEVQKMVKENPMLKGNTRVQMGLTPFRGTEIRSNLLGMKVVITQEHIAKMLGLDNTGENVFNYKTGKMYKEAIQKDLYEIQSNFGKVASLKVEFRVAFRVMLASIFTRTGGNDTISWPHRHFIFFMIKKVKLIWLHACLSISALLFQKDITKKKQ
jgi:hypothetical protein